MPDTQELKTALEARLAERVDSPLSLTNLEMLAGGSSQETWRLDLTVEEGSFKGFHPLILRRPLGGSIFEIALDLKREFAVVCAASQNGVPSPRPYWMLEEVLGAPATLVERLNGESIGRKLVRATHLAAARHKLPAQLGTALAALHQVDYAAYGLDRLLSKPERGQTPAQTRLAQIEAELDALDEPHPVLELALNWLRRHEPAPPPKLVLIHGDFRIGNVLVNEDGLVALIDWEFSHLGDYAEDLAYPLVREWRFGMDRLRLGGIGQPEEYFQAYEAASQFPVDPDRVAYWELIGNVWWAVGLLKQTKRHLSGEQPNLEFACLGRRCCEMELEILNLLRLVPVAAGN